MSRFALVGTLLTSMPRLRNTRAEMYAGRVACCLLVSHVAPRVRKKIGTDGRMPDRHITLVGRVASERLSVLSCTVEKLVTQSAL